MSAMLYVEYTTFYNAGQLSKHHFLKFTHSLLAYKKSHINLGLQFTSQNFSNSTLTLIHLISVKFI